MVKRTVRPKCHPEVSHFWKLKNINVARQIRFRKSTSQNMHFSQRALLIELVTE